MMVTKRSQRKENNFLLILLIALGFASCSNVRVYTPTSKFVTSETSGRLFAGTATVGQQALSEATINLDEDQIDNPVDLNNEGGSIASSFEMGLFSKMDFFIKPSYFTPILTGVKFQFLGESRAAATEGSTSLSATIASGGYGRANSGSGLFYSGDLNGYDLTHNTTDLSVILGHRFQADTLTYLSLSKTTHTVEVELKSDSNAALDGKEISLKNDVTGLHLGLVRYWKVYFLNLEASVQENKWSNTDDTTFAHLNLNMGWKWN